MRSASTTAGSSIPGMARWIASRSCCLAGASRPRPVTRPVTRRPAAFFFFIRVHRCPFWLIWFKNRGRSLVCLVVQSTTRAIYFPKEDTYVRVLIAGTNTHTASFGSLCGPHGPCRAARSLLRSSFAPLRGEKRRFWRKRNIARRRPSPIPVWRSIT